MPKMFKNIKLKNVLIILSVIVFITVFDQITKLIIKNNLELGQSVVVIPGLFRFTYVLNPGAAFGMLSSSRWIFLIVSSVAIIILLSFLILYSSINLGQLLPLSFICAGGIGNMIDRLFNGVSFGNGLVIDFIDFYPFPEIWSYVFNVADSFVCIGAFGYLIYAIVDIIKNKKDEKRSSKD